ncbi:dihydrofolate reductase family protein [Alkalihalobacillus trypoxylicola]|uniref:Bacterial bifunctional deaminase-reductase C-terminal domain-containing protein n=1 Tax=Alkalihalobacillus trypoxylicola TaxID=519424 RepID=A0A162DFI1_9BACI|nr:dihydrofolate reductase family protein [Alkalihalobacillus trypoxylicola]KYG29465.1 hypothetical protein AZF04_08050 [Alkalihalobacillus trypoxylicola]
MNTNRKVMLFIAVSLDGYIATEEDKLDWLFEVEGEGDNGISDFYKTIDTVIMGRKTFNWINNPAHIEEFPYADKKSYVLTRSQLEHSENITFINPNIVDFVKELKQRPGKDIWLLGGGELVTSFAKKGLIDEVIMTIAPKVIGQGISLFQKGDYFIDLHLKNVKTYNQFVELHYVVNHE